MSFIVLFIHSVLELSNTLRPYTSPKTKGENSFHFNLKFKSNVQLKEVLNPSQIVEHPKLINQLINST